MSKLATEVHPMKKWMNVLPVGVPSLPPASSPHVAFLSTTASRIIQNGGHEKRMGFLAEEKLQRLQVG